MHSDSKKRCSFLALLSAAGDVSVHGDFVAMNRGADCVQPLALSPLAPEQGAGPDTAHQSIRLRLLARRTEPVSTAIISLKK